MVVGGDLCSKGVSSNPSTKNWMDIFSHLFGVRIVMFVWKDKHKRKKRPRMVHFLKTFETYVDEFAQDIFATLDVSQLVPDWCIRCTLPEGLIIINNPEILPLGRAVFMVQLAERSHLNLKAKKLGYFLKHFFTVWWKGQNKENWPRMAHLKIYSNHGSSVYP